MIGRNKYRNIGSFKDFSVRGKDTDKYYPILNNYTERVKEEIIEQLIQDKNMSNNDSEDFLNNIFSLGDKRLKEIKGIISDSFSKDKNVKNCASLIISKFYKITKINKYDDPYTHEEVLEISESLLDYLKGPTKDELFYKAISSSGEEQYNILRSIIKNGYKDILIDLFDNNIYISEENGTKLVFDALLYDDYIILDILLKNGLKPNSDAIFFAKTTSDEGVADKLRYYKNQPIKENRFYHYEDVPSKLFWNFIRITNDLKVKFIFNTSLINNYSNSLNNKEYLFYIETDELEKDDLFFEFENSIIFNKFLKYLNSDEKVVKLFIGINKLNKLRFGYLIGDKRYVIGNVNYKSLDFKKLDKNINYINGDIPISEISRKFKSTITILNNLKDIIETYIHFYTDVKMYVDLENGVFSLKIQTDDEDILNTSYLNNILESNKVYRLNVEFNLEEIKRGSIITYKITIK